MEVYICRSLPYPTLLPSLLNPEPSDLLSSGEPGDSTRNQKKKRVPDERKKQKVTEGEKMDWRLTAVRCLETRVWT